MVTGGTVTKINKGRAMCHVKRMVELTDD